MAKKLVIIDDSSTQLNILKTFFTKNGWEVCGVQNAKIGYEIIFDFAPDLIITDAIMPLMGGFQLIKLIRENKIISKIPVIVYSILNEKNAKFYINEELSEYFLKKDNNQDELLALAESVTEKFPLDKEYKDEILRAGLENYKSIQKQNEIIEEEIEEENKENTGNNEEIISTEEIQTIEDIPENKFNIENFESKIKNINDFTIGDEKLISNLFSILYESFQYDLAIFNAYSFENFEKRSFFDIKNIILSPIFKNFIMNKYETKSCAMYKKYAPNLTMAVNESEFLSKIELNFEYKNENIADFIFYSFEKLKWENNEHLEEIKEILSNFSKTRHIQKGSQANKKDNYENKYNQTNNEFNNIKSNENAYFIIMQIANYSDLSQNIPSEDMDILNSKLSEQIIQCLNKDEQVYRSEEGEYSIVIFAKDEKQIRHRIDFIINEIKKITYNEYSAEIFAAAANCNIEGSFNILEAQKNARKLAEETLHQENVVIYNE